MAQKSLDHRPKILSKTKDGSFFLQERSHLSQQQQELESFATLYQHLASAVVSRLLASPPPTFTAVEIVVASYLSSMTVFQQPSSLRRLLQQPLPLPSAILLSSLPSAAQASLLS